MLDTDKNPDTDTDTNLETDATNPEVQPRNPEEQSSIEDTVIATIVRTSAMTVTGVHDVGSTSLTKAVSERFGGSDKNSRGVDIVLGDKGAVVDIALTVKYGHAIPEIITNVRNKVRAAVAEICGLDAKVINITVAKIEVEDVDHARRALVS